MPSRISRFVQFDGLVRFFGGSISASKGSSIYHSRSVKLLVYGMLTALGFGYNLSAFSLKMSNGFYRGEGGADFPHSYTKVGRNANLNADISPRHSLTERLSIMKPQLPMSSQRLSLLKPLRHWLDGIEIHDPKQARFVSKMIPAQCPFERELKIFGRTIAHIPPLCKLNPLYDQLVGLRFRALCYLVDVCGEDIQAYA